ncbi:MAG: YkgJ family cysteine cluster protein [bacterium]
MCGLCCRLFLINLNEKEYYSGDYSTVFDCLEPIHDFSLASDYGANILKQKEDGSCIYLESNKCSIHENRPEVCRDFYCSGTEKEYAGMREIIAKARLKD